ncbi:MAG: type II secretion system secretin GspD [Deltaproteobacteria bacterium]|nr:type II secretion system secretin GspD [Deltaproteobacteria bacterium]
MRRPVIVLAVVMGLLWSLPAGSRAQEAEAEGDEKQITMDFQDVDLAVLVKFISDITHKNFIVDEKVKGKITIISPSKISVDEAYLVFQSVLQVKGFTTVPSGTVIKILPTKEAKTSTLRTIVPKGGVSPSDEFITRLIPLEHVDANNMVSIMQPMVSPDGLLAAYAPTNSLILIDTAANSARLLRILIELDVEGRERGIEVLRLNYAFATEIAATLAQVLEEGQSPQAGAMPPPAASRAARGGAPAAAGGAVTGGVTPQRSFKIIPDERTNTLIVLAGPLEMRRIKDLVTRLDVPLPLGTGRIHVYYLKYANAFELVAVLADLIGSGGGGGMGGMGAGLRSRGMLGAAGGIRGGRTGRTGIGGGGGGFGGGFGDGFDGGGGMGGGFAAGSLRGGSRGGRSGSRAGLSAATGFGGAAAGSGAAGGIGGAGSAEADGVRITADPATNALIVNASPQDYETIKEVIEKLDVRRRQVYVEAIILEVRLNKARDLGFDFQGGAGLAKGVGLGRINLSGNLNQMLTSPAGLDGLILAAASNQTVRLPDGSTVPAQVALFTALQNDSDVNILSAPNLLTTDNQEAEIVVGQNLPFVASRSTSETNLANQFNTIERRDVGITLRITPQISEGGTVRLDLFQEVSAVVPSASDAQAIALGPTTTIRSATTTVVARDNQTVVIGGLISDDMDNSHSRVPFLGDIPVLGNLMRNTSSRREKINLLIFLTPHIVRSEEDQRRLSLEQRDRLKAFMEEQRIPNKRTEVLDRPSWETLPPPAKGGEKSDENGSNSNGQPPAAGSTPPLNGAAVEPPRYALLASFWEHGKAPASLAAANGLVPLALPEDSELRGLFVRGQDVRFESDTYTAFFHCLDTFTTQEEALVVYPEGLRVSGEPRELLHWRDLASDASARNAHSWTAAH